MGMDDFARAAAFSVWLEDALAGALATWTGGTAVLDPAAPDVWDSNHLRLERRWDEPPESFPAAVEDAARACGLRTPVVAIADPAQVTQLGDALRAAGYVRDGFVDALVAMCRLMSRGAVGQVEDVSTLPAFRHRGCARALVGAAVTASRDAGHALTFIIAHEDDWPRRLYATLGFALVGTTSRFRKI
jgi:ribosomal protein S18 acetylase RimI-like enzyme